MKRVGVITIAVLVIAMIGCILFSSMRTLPSKSAAGTDKSIPIVHGVPGYVELGPRGVYTAGSFKVITFTPMAKLPLIVTPAPKVTK